MHRFAQIGIEGSNGLHYGPLPTWLYQGFLAFSQDLRLLVMLRALVTMVGCAMGLTWLARGLRVSRWLVPISLASPYLWIYARTIWDNTFLIPLAALSLGAYVAFLTERRTGLLLCAAVCALIMPLIHLMALALLVPMALHALVFARREISRARYALLAILIVWLIVAHGYFTWLINNRFSATTVRSVVAATFPFMGGRWLSAVGLDEFFQESWHQVVSGTTWLDLARLLTALLLPAVWIGMVLAYAELKSASPVRRPALILLVTVVATQMALDGMTGAAGRSHYFNATWPVFAALSWLTLDRLLGFRWTRWIPGIIGASLIIVLGTVIVRVHRLGGTRGDGYGPLLSNQMAIARGLNQYGSNSRVRTDVANFLQFPQGLAVLRLLDHGSGGSRGPGATLAIRYVGGQGSGRVALMDY